jgi:hypothetical protein
MAGHTWAEIADTLDWPYPSSRKHWLSLRREREALAEIFESHLRLVPSRPIPAWPWPPYYYYWSRRPLGREWRVAAAHLNLQLGNAVEWRILLQEIYDLIAGSSRHVLYLSDLDQLARAVPCSPDDVLVALTYLTRSPRALLRMELRAGSEKGPIVSMGEMLTKMKDWHRAKTLPDQEWRSWTSNIWVMWTEQGMHAS